MEKNFSDIIDNFKLEKIKNDKRIIVFTVCLLIATALWFLNALEKNYSASLSYPVKYVNPPDGLFLANTPPSNFELDVEAHGFTLLRYKLAFPFSPLKIDLSEISQGTGGNGKAIVIQGEDLIRQMSNQVGNEISITDISPKAFSLIFDNMKTRMVPVLPLVSLGFKPQFNLRGLLFVEPESLKVSGPGAIVDTIQFIYTEPEIFQNLDKKTERVVKVKPPPNTNISVENVILHLPVEKFTEKTVSLPVLMTNKPEELKIKLFPPQVSVSFLVGLSDYENISADDFSAGVSYSQVIAGDTILEVFLDSLPPFIQSIKISPGSVEYLVESE